MQNIARLARNMRPLLNSHILLVGRGDEFQLLKNLKIDWNLENLTILDAVSQTNYESILSCVDIGLISLSALHSSHNIPGKLLGYVKYGLPILGSVNNENDLIDLVNDSHSGFISINGEDDKFVSNAKALVDSHDLRKKMGKSSSKLLKSISQQIMPQKLLCPMWPKKTELKFKLMYRFFDITLSLWGLVFLSPVLILLFIIVYFDTKLPFFSQVRLGKTRNNFGFINSER